MAFPMAKLATMGTSAALFWQMAFVITFWTVNLPCLAMFSTNLCIVEIAVGSFTTGPASSHFVIISLSCHFDLCRCWSSSSRRWSSYSCLWSMGVSMYCQELDSSSHIHVLRGEMTVLGRAVKHHHLDFARRWLRERCVVPEISPPHLFSS